MKVYYDIAVPPEVALEEAVTIDRSQLAIHAEDGALAIDAVVQRFRERLKRRGLV